MRLSAARSAFRREIPKAPLPPSGRPQGTPQRPCKSSGRAMLGRMASVFSELRRRRVYRVALAYGVFASAMIQVGGTILPLFHAPEWSQQVMVVLIAAGFPLALVLG